MKRIINTIFLTTILILLNLLNLTSQNEDIFRVGVFLGPNFIFNNTSIPLIPGTDDCGNYENGRQNSFLGGITYTYKFIPNLLWFEGRLFYESRPAYLNKETIGYQVYQESSDSYVSLLRNHEFDAELQYLAIDIGAKLLPLRDFPLYTRLSFDVGNPIISTNYTNIEVIKSPSNINYSDGTKLQVVESGELKNAGTALGASFAIGYEYKLKNGLILSPEISYRKGLNSIASDRDWNMDIVRAIFQVSWDFGAENDVILPAKEIEVVHINEPEPEPKHELINETPKIENVNSSKVRFVETVVTQTYPILPYMFFDSASSDIRKIYISEDKLINEKTLPKNSIDIYYRFLDIIATRLIENPNSSITIVGVTDGNELSDSTLRAELAINRAISASKYLQDKYGVKAESINLKSRDLPLIPTSNKYSEGPQENRRIEVLASNPAILQPVSHSQFLEYQANNSSIGIKAKFRNINKIDSVRYEILKGGNLMTYKTFEKEFENVTIELNERLINELGAAATFETNTNIRTIIYDNGTIQDSKISTLELESDRNKFELGRLNLIVFDYDKSNISSINKNMIEDFISNNISSDSKVKITGSTDRLGENNYNIELSQARAETVQNYILKLNPDANIEEVKGIGSSVLPFDNNLPEGRFYCRTVLIEVKTPLKAK